MLRSKLLALFPGDRFHYFVSHVKRRPRWERRWAALRAEAAWEARAEASALLAALVFIHVATDLKDRRVSMQTIVLICFISSHKNGRFEIPPL